MLLPVSEIFSSLQGESKYTGYPTTFVRLYGCNMLCTFCDTMYAVRGGKFKRIGFDKITGTVREMGNKHVCVTGGEPMMHPETLPLVYELIEKGYTVTIETNGGIKLENQQRSFMYIMDIKTPSSGMASKNIMSNLDILQGKDELKFVIADETDYAFAMDILAKRPRLACPVIFSPCFTPENESTIARELAMWIIADKPRNVRLGVQIHKIVGLA